MRHGLSAVGRDSMIPAVWHSAGNLERHGSRGSGLLVSVWPLDARQVRDGAEVLELVGADAGFARATTWEELQAVHARFLHDYNVQDHFAHLQRTDGKRSPQAVLGWVKGLWCDSDTLDRLFQVRFQRSFDENGYVRFRRWRVYGERGLAGRPGAAWVFGEVLSLTFEGELLAQYQVQYAPDGRHIRALSQARLFPNGHPSPQPYLPGLEAEWPLTIPVPAPPPRRRVAALGVQGRLFAP